MKKNTAIEWLEMEIVILEALYPIPNAIYKLCEMAKEKEKEQIMNAFEDGHTAIINSEQYYNETYGKA